MLLKVKVTYNLYDFRMKAGLTIRQLAELSGVSKTVINDAENNVKDIQVGTLCKLAKALNVKPEELYSYKIYN